MSIILMAFFLAIVYLVLEGVFFPAVANLRTVIPENTSYNWEELRKTYKYAAINIFHKGYAREIGSEIHPRISTYPELTPLDNGNFVIKSGSPEKIFRMVLPQGFKDGVLSLQVTTPSKYSIGTSYDLKNWKFGEYPGFNSRALAVVTIEGTIPAAEYLYLKVFSINKDELSVYFDVFQYTSSLLYDANEYSGVLFFPEEDIDYEGKKVIQPAIYGKYSPNKDK